MAFGTLINHTSCEPVGKAAAPLPPSFVKATGDMAWGRQLRPSEFTYDLTGSDVDEIERALIFFQELELDGPDVTPSTFPLPTLASKLRGLAHEIHSGNGVVVISGLDPQKYSAEANAILFLGISSYTGSERGMQDDSGNMMMHLRDPGPCGFDMTKYSNKSTHFHSEFYCDVLAFHVRAEPLTGGSLYVASSWDIYKHLSVAQPETLQELMSPTWHRGNLFPACTRPLLYLHGDRVILSFSRRPLVGAITRATQDMVGRLTARQSELLQAIQALAVERRVEIAPRSGNMIFINNHAILHARDQFHDGPDRPGHHVARLWLRNPSLAWDLPVDLEAGNWRIYGENGIRERWEVEPVSLGDLGSDGCTGGPGYDAVGSSH